MPWIPEPGRTWRWMICLAVLAAPSAAQSRIQISGTVRREQTFQREIGSGLTFVLDPHIPPVPEIGPPPGSVDTGSHGWTIKIRAVGGSDSFIRCVIEPIHGLTAADIVVEQFVTEDNEQAPESTYPEKREFPFVLNATDQKKACDELDVIAYGCPTITKDGEIAGTPGDQSPRSEKES